METKDIVLVIIFPVATNLIFWLVPATDRKSKRW